MPVLMCGPVFNASKAHCRLLPVPAFRNSAHSRHEVVTRPVAREFGLCFGY